MTLMQVFESLPLADKTVVKHKFTHQGYKLVNDLGYPSVYRVVGTDGIELGAVKYYKGRKLCAYEKVKRDR